jgi:orotate phosphoribosyltransferase
MVGNTDELISLLTARSAQRGDFVLASGRRSTLYIDARLTTMSPQGLALVGPLGLRAIREAGWLPDSIGGLTLGADPIAYAISYWSTIEPPLVRSFTVRKEPKTHGTKKLIEGPFRTGDATVIIEDVVTTGASALKAVEAVRESGGTVLGILALIDRQEGGEKVLESAGFRLKSLVTAAQIVDRLGA